MNAAAAMIDADREDPEGPAGARRCIVTGASVPRERLLRFVVDPRGEVVFDAGAKLPGRGLWVLAEAAVLARADARTFARAARGPVTVPGDLPARVEAMLARRLADYLGMARRAGALVAGFEKTRSALKAGGAHLLIAARDGAADGRGKLKALAPGLEEMTALTAAEIGAALGREAVVHAAVTEAPLAAAIMGEGRRLAGLRPGDGKMRAGNVFDKVDKA